MALPTFLRRIAIAALAGSIACIVSDTAAAPPAAIAPASSFATRLPNGLTIIIDEDHHSPSVSMMLAYGAGSGAEPSGDPGLAALTFRMMTEQTAHLGPDRYRTELDRIGAQSVSQYVDADDSSVAVTVPSHAVATVLWLWSDQMGFFVPAATEQLLDKERTILQSERRQTIENAAYGAVGEIVGAALYPDRHPYHATAISSAFDTIRLRDVKDFHDTHYGPESAVLVLSGDVQRDRVMADVEKYFGPIPRASSTRPHVAPVSLSGEVRLDVEAAVRAPMVVVSWPTPAEYTAPDADLDLAALMMSGLRVARLNWKLLDEMHAATMVTANQASRALGSTFEVRAVVAPGHGEAEVLAAIDEVIDSMRTQPADPQTFRHAMADLMVPRTFALERPSVRASKLASLALAPNDGAGVPRDLERFGQCTPETVRDAIVKLLPRDRRVVTIVTPGTSAPPGGTLRAARTTPAKTNKLELDTP